MRLLTRVVTFTTGILVMVMQGLASLVALNEAIAATPALYVYTGSVPLVYRFENMLGRKVDGVTQFDAFDSPAVALGALNAGLPSLCGQGWGVSMRFPAAFSNMTLQQVAAGGADAAYAAMFKEMEKCVAPTKIVSIGHEMNGGPFYPWAAKGGPAFIAAYKHVLAIGRVDCPSCKLTWNPGMTGDPRPFYPGDDQMDELDWDYYATVYASGGKYDEASLEQGNLHGYWALDAAGPASGKGWKASLPLGFPEMGVGGESNGMGVCPAKNPSGCDDGPLTAAILAYMVKTGATRISWWDFDGGGYNSLLSDGLRPAEMIALCQVYCVSSVANTLVGATAYTGTTIKKDPPTGYRTILALLANGHVEQLAWGDKAGQPLQATDLTVKLRRPRRASSPRADGHQQPGCEAHCRP